MGLMVRHEPVGIELFDAYSKSRKNQQRRKQGKQRERIQKGARKIKPLYRTPSEVKL
jgi:hypothetical protein